MYLVTAWALNVHTYTYLSFNSHGTTLCNRVFVVLVIFLFRRLRCIRATLKTRTPRVAPVSRYNTGSTGILTKPRYKILLKLSPAARGLNSRGETALTRLLPSSSRKTIRQFTGFPAKIYYLGCGFFFKY